MVSLERTRCFIVLRSHRHEDGTLQYLFGDSFKEKSRAVFDQTVGSDSVVDQLCNQAPSLFDLPVDCALGLAVGGWSQGAHMAALAGNYTPDYVTAALLYALRQRGRRPQLGRPVRVGRQNFPFKRAPPLHRRRIGRLLREQLRRGRGAADLHLGIRLLRSRALSVRLPPPAAGGVRL